MAGKTTKVEVEQTVTETPETPVEETTTTNVDTVAETPVETPSGESQQVETAPQSGDQTVTRDANYWQSKYNGQQGYIQTLRNQIGSKDQAIMDLETQLAQVKSQLNTLTGEKTTLAQEAEQLREFKTTVEKQNTVRQAIAKEYPELVSAYDAGLMLGAEGLEGEALTGYLENFQKFVGANVRQTLQGTVPPPPAQGQEKPAATSYQDLQHYLLSHTPGTPEWDRANEQYMAALKQRAASGEAL